MLWRTHQSAVPRPSPDSYHIFVCGEIDARDVAALRRACVYTAYSMPEMTSISHVSCLISRLSSLILDLIPSLSLALFPSVTHISHFASLSEMREILVYLG